MDDQLKADELSITVQELKEYRISFKYCDVEGKGHISFKELKTTMQLHGAMPSDEEMKTIIAEFDNNGNGMLEFEEFVRLMESRKKTTNDLDDLAHAFKLFDMDGNGVLDSAELRVALTGMGEVMTEEEVDELIKSADTNGDGLIDYKEFFTMITGNPPPEESGQQKVSTQQKQPSDANLTV